MKHIINVTAVRSRLVKKPIGQRLHHFFNGSQGQLSKEELTELKKVLNKEHKKMIAIIDKYPPANANN